MLGSRRMFGCLSENSKVMPPGWNHDDQLEDGCENKVWDLGSHKEDQLWEPMVCEEPHQSLELLTLNDEAQWKSKHWWTFKDGFKHKPP